MSGPFADLAILIRKIVQSRESLVDLSPVFRFNNNRHTFQGLDYVIR